jgi:hypothetical protein
MGDARQTLTRSLQEATRDPAAPNPVLWGTRVALRMAELALMATVE